ncbi:MAG: ABC transporter ATP-binding protein [bacterium]|nr:ABC transporter ATP-binding protein [bacterium]MDE0242949.1 ABC transporter ATP-binding protein [bacterium]MDE0416708.1 ABC transporter ATP-binding protein [bacterium]
MDELSQETARSPRPLLVVDGVSKYFGALAAVDNLSFEVMPGEVLGIGGPNGAGKTTLFDVITGLDRASSGHILFAGDDITRAGPERICHAGIARTFQLNAGFDTLSVRENIEVAAIYGHEAPVFPGFRVRPVIRRRVDEALELSGLTDRATTPAGELAVLERKLLMVATAIVTQPRLLMLDEPVGGLTQAEMDAFVAMLARIRGEGMAIILIEHVMRFLVTLADRVLIMHHGERIYEGRPDDLANDRRVVDVYLGDGAADLIRAALDPGAAP